MARETNTKLSSFQTTQDTFKEVEALKNVVTAFLTFSWYIFSNVEKQHPPMYFLDSCPLSFLIYKCFKSWFLPFQRHMLLEINTPSLVISKHIYNSRDYDSHRFFPWKHWEDSKVTGTKTKGNINVQQHYDKQ